MSANTLLHLINDAVDRNLVMQSTANNIAQWVEAGFLPKWALESIEELLVQKKWIEVNDRFYKQLTFGTGGMRSRTIGNVITSQEAGEKLNACGSPRYPGVGTNMLNDFNIIRATIGLYKYCKEYVGQNKTPKLVIAHDVRYFSRHFCELAATTWGILGGEALIFDGPRSTPQLSFSVRYLKATAGVVITASHNPPHDNGFKVYFEDGGQIVSPHPEGITKQIDAVNLSTLGQFLEVDKKKFEILEPEYDESYLKVIEESILDIKLLRVNSPKIVFTPIHGTGQVSIVPLLQRLNIEYSVVKEQMVMDAGFSSVKSPNPENEEALSKGIKLAEKIQADVVIGTDPDGDRMGVAVRNSQGKMELLNGNIIGSLLAEYRISKLKALGKIPVGYEKNAVLIKTFVTTPLLEEISKNYGLKVINTPTGFKWIGEKLYDYEKQLLKKLREKNANIDYDSLNKEERRNLLLKYSTYFVFGGEESYGYLANDQIRDKDANEAAVTFCELSAYLKSQNMLFEDYLNSVYLKYGYFAESLVNLYFEGASGSSKIKAILESYLCEPPKFIGKYKVSSIQDFRHGQFVDVDGKKIPNENFYFVTLENNYSFGVRGSGTEPKIKFYLFARETALNLSSLEDSKKKAESTLKEIGQFLEKDARVRSCINSDTLK